MSLPTINNVNDQTGIVVAKDASPTGTPVIPPKVVPFLLVGTGILQVIAEELANPGPWTLGRTISLIVKVVTFVALGASPGLRKK